MTERVSIDPPPIHPADATTLMAHHLALATAYFEASPDELAPGYAAIARAFPTHDMGQSAARVWLATLQAHYDAADNAPVE